MYWYFSFECGLICSDTAVYRKTTWHCDPDADQNNSQYTHENPPNAPSMSNKDGLQLVANAARRVWEELYIHKKPVSEVEIFTFVKLCRGYAQIC